MTLRSRNVIYEKSLNEIKKKEVNSLILIIKRKMKATAHILFESFQDANTLFTVIRWIKGKKYYHRHNISVSVGLRTVFL